MSTSRLVELVWYSVGDDPVRRKLRCLENRPSFMTAEEAAKDYHSLTAGEADWPATVTLYQSETGPEISRHKVIAEVELVFSAVNP